MSKYSFNWLVGYEESDEHDRYLQYMATQMVFDVVWKTLRLLIIIVGLVLVVVALVAAGAADQVSTVISHWPLIP